MNDCPGQCGTARSVDGILFDHRRVWKWKSGASVFAVHPYIFGGWRDRLADRLEGVRHGLPVEAVQKIAVYAGDPENDWYNPGSTATVFFHLVSAPTPVGLVRVSWV